MKVIGFGDPVLDLITHVSYESHLVGNTNLEAGGCVAITQQEMQNLLDIPEIKDQLTRHPGGSAANVVKSLARLLQPTQNTSKSDNRNHHKVSFIGMIGQDESGREYKKGLESHGVEPLLLESSTGAQTACCLCIVTPDGQRTMRTFLGAALELNSPTQLPELSKDGSIDLMHFEGYCLYRVAVSKEAMKLAQAAGARVSLDFASFEVVRNCWDSLKSILEEKLVDLCFLNEDEARAVCHAAGLQHGDDDDDVVDCTLKYLQPYCRSGVVISRGKKGCIASSDGSRATSKASNVVVEDTVGAGDSFTAGYLYAWLQGSNLQQCTDCGCAAGTSVVQCSGATLDDGAAKQLQLKLETIVSRGGKKAMCVVS